MDSSNFSAYRSGRKHSYTGGLAKKSPVRLAIPHSGHWHVTVDMAGLSGTVRSSARILPGSLPPLREPPLSSLPSLVHAPERGRHHESGDETQSFDVFIAHASEDKQEVARPLALALRSAGLVVWYDEFELRIGDSLRRKIDSGLANSRFGVIILSRHFFEKGWPNYELDGLVTLGVAGDQVLLPIWHQITQAELLKYSPSLADKVARNTTTHTIDQIATEIAEVIQGTL